MGGDPQAEKIEALEREVARLAREGEQRERFLALVVHELLNPLNAIAVGAHHLLSGSGISEAQAQTLRRIVRSGDRMSRTIKDLTDFATDRLGAGLSIVPGAMDLGEVCRAALADTPTVGFDARGALTGDWDAERVAQVVTQLVAHAVHQSGDAAAVSVSVDGQPDEVLVRVRSAGRETPDDELARLFEPFKRSGRDEAAGLGLGLYLARQLVRAHGGSLEVTSSAADGTVFTARWPRRR